MNTLPAPKPRPAGLEVSDPLEQFLAGQLSRRTRTAYRADLRDFFAYLGLQTGDLEAVRRIGFQDVIGYRNHLAGQGLRRTSINRKLSSLRAFFRMLVAAGYLEKNPADPALVRGYKIDDTLTGKAISTKALKSISQSIEAEEDELVKSRDLAIFHLLVLGGLRRSEAARVSWSDIVEEGVFHVLRLPETKSGVAQEIKLQPLVMHYLGAYRQTLEHRGYPTDGPVFISLSRNCHGKPLTDQSINLIVKRHALRAGVPRAVTAHMFRHTCCTLAIEGGARPQQVQAHLRHKDLKTTMRYYENRERLVDNASDYIHLG
ncbi:MAG: tyrosine-type recombinase/integrase [Candidatus Latescibacterota bacterium]